MDALGAALVFMVGPTLGALSVAFPAAAPVLLTVAEEVLSSAVLILVTGVREKVKEREPPAPEDPGVLDWM